MVGSVEVAYWKRTVDIRRVRTSFYCLASFSFDYESGFAGKEHGVDYALDLWWDRFEVLAGKVHQKSVEDCFFRWSTFVHVDWDQ